VAVRAERDLDTKDGPASESMDGSACRVAALRERPAMADALTSQPCPAAAELPVARQAVLQGSVSRADAAARLRPPDCRLAEQEHRDARPADAAAQAPDEARRESPPMAASSACRLVQEEAAGAVRKGFVPASEQKERLEQVSRELLPRAKPEERPEPDARMRLSRRWSPMADAAGAWDARVRQALPEFLSAARERPVRTEPAAARP